MAQGAVREQQIELRILRERAGLSQRELGTLLGVSATAIGRWERGLHAPERRNWRALVAALGLDEAALGDLAATVRDDSAHLVMRCPGCRQQVGSARELVEHERAHPECVDWYARGRDRAHVGRSGRRL